MWTVLYRHPRALLLTLALIAGFGAVSYSVIPRSEDPRITNRYSFIITEWEGAGAERVESQVTEKIEQQLLELKEVRRFRSTTVSGVSVIQLELKGNVTDVDNAWSRVRDRLTALSPELPRGCSAPYLADNEEADAYTMIVALSWNGDGPAPYGVINRLAGGLEKKFRMLPGTEYTRLFGAPREEVLVEVKPEVLANLGLTMDALAGQIARNDPKTTAGRFLGPSNQLSIEVSGELDTVARLNDTPIRPGGEGPLLRLGDIAEVRRTVADPPSELAIFDGKPGIAVAIRMENRQRIDGWAGRARKVFEEFGASLSPNLKAEMIFDQSEYVGASIRGLETNLVMGAFSVFLVTWFMMGWRSSLLIGVSPPLTTLMVLGCMNLHGIPIHQISMMGIILAIGLLIDNAIIVVDEIRVRLDRGLAIVEAMHDTCRVLAMPLFASTVTTVLAFVPVLLMGGATGDFVGTLGWTVFYALLCSLVLSLTIVPALAGWGLRRAGKENGGKSRWWRDGFTSQRVSRAYLRTVQFAIKRPMAGMAAAVILPILGFAIIPQLPLQFFPPAKRDQFYIQAKLPAQSPIGQTQARAMRMREAILDHEGIERVDLYVGVQIPRFFYNVFSWDRQSPNLAGAMIHVKHGVDPIPVIRQLQEDLDAGFPDMQVVCRALEQGEPFKAPIELRLLGPDLDVLQEYGGELRRILAELPEVTQTEVSLMTGKPKITVTIDDDKADGAGLSRVNIARSLSTALEGATGGTIIETSEALPIRVRIKDEHRGDLSRIASLELVPEAGPSRAGNVPVSAIGDITLATEFSGITHWDGERTNDVYGYLEAGLFPAEVLARFREKLAASGFTLPSGYRLMYGGEEETREESVGNLLAYVPLIAFGMFGILVLSFNSFRLALLIGVVGVLSIGLGMLSLWVLGYPLGFMAIIGTMGMVGVAVNDSIVVLAAIRDNPRARAGDPDAILATVRDCSRHVIATSITIVGGCLPLFVAGGQFWPPLAAALSGGVLGATPIALYFIPAAYIVAMRRRDPSPAAEPRRSMPPAAMPLSAGTVS